MTFLSTKIANMLFGKHTLSMGDQLGVQNTMTYPDGTKIVWKGYEGLIVTLFNQIWGLERRIRELEAKKK